MTIREFLDSAVHDVVGHGFAAMAGISAFVYNSVSDPSRLTEGVLSGLIGGGLIMAGTHYKMVHDLNRKYAGALQDIKDNPERLETLDSFFDDVGNGELHYGNVARSHQKASLRFTKSLYDRQRAKVVAA
jgi:hypothetical protein